MHDIQGCSQFVATEDVRQCHPSWRLPGKNVDYFFPVKLHSIVDVG